jgi:DNA gyrase subunit B
MELSPALLQAALDGAQMSSTADDRIVLAGQELMTLCTHFQHFLAIIKRLASRMDPRLIQTLSLISEFNSQWLQQPAELHHWVDEELIKQLNADSPTTTTYHAEWMPDHPHHFALKRTVYGIVEAEKWIPFDFFIGADYEQIRVLKQQLQHFAHATIQVKREQRTATVTDFAQAYEWLLNEAKRGYHIQRYKGLGEMNPDQLWDTTMDPATRRLLQVKIEDAVNADQTFTTLMGDDVEPRKKFIEDYALDVERIDI